MIIFTFLGAILFLSCSAFFSSSETALFSIPRERHNFYRNNQKKSFKLVYQLLTNGQQTLLLILLCNLFVNTAVVGLIHTLTTVFLPHNSGWPTLVIATVVIVTFGEILPKNIALQHNEKIAVLISKPLYYLMMASRPVLMLLQKINTWFLLKFSTFLRKPSPFVTLEELLSGVNECSRDGTISLEEAHVLKRVLQYGEEPVSRFMIHRSQCLFVEKSETIPRVIDKLQRKNTYVACVMANVGENSIIGLVYLSDLLMADGSGDLGKIIDKPFWIPDTMETADLIGVLIRNQRVHASCMDEFGGFSGLFSLNYGLDRLFHFRDFSPTQSFPSKENRVKTTLKGDEDLERIADWIPPSMKKHITKVRTLNGLITRYLGKIPEKDFVFAVDGWTFYILDVKPNYIETVSIEKRITK